MKKSFLNLLRCPNTREILKLTIYQQEKDEIIEGFLSSSNFKYMITNGIPRFINNDGYSKNFGWQWKKWSRTQFENENIGLPMEKYTINMFKKITEFNTEKISGKLVLDIGCGSGKFTDVANSLGAKMVAIDYSSAIDVCKKNLNNNNILFVQGDALNLPFNDDIFDYSFSIGVLHHTPDPYIGVKEAFRVLKKKMLSMHFLFIKKIVTTIL